MVAARVEEILTAIYEVLKPNVSLATVIDIAANLSSNQEKFELSIALLDKENLPEPVKHLGARNK